MGCTSRDRGSTGRGRGGEVIRGGEGMGVVDGGS
jgi:hypothetical protein